MPFFIANIDLISRSVWWAQLDISANDYDGIN